MVEALLDAGFEAVAGGLVVDAAAFQTALRHKTALVIVRIQIALAIAELLRALVMAIAQVSRHRQRASLADKLKLGLNAGHDLNLDNLRFFAQNIPNLLEVSIGHALISDAIYFGLENTIRLYLNQLR